MGIIDYRVVQSSGEDRYAENAVKEVVKGVQDYLDRGGRLETHWRNMRYL